MDTWAIRPAKEQNADLDESSVRDLIYDFFDLPFHKQMAIAVELDLVQDEDYQASASAIPNRIFRRAFQARCLDRVWDAVQNALCQPVNNNPFRRNEDS